MRKQGKDNQFLSSESISLVTPSDDLPGQNVSVFREILPYRSYNLVSKFVNERQQRNIDAEHKK